MKPVTDPALLEQLNSGAPGSDSPGLPPASAPSFGRSAPKPADFERPPAEDMNFGEKLLAGAGAGASRLYSGVRSLLPPGLLPAGESDAERAGNKEAMDKLGGWGTVGEVVGETAPLLPVQAGAATAKVLTRALPALAKVGSVGGRVFNLGAAGRAATEGALMGGAVAPDEGESRLGNAAAAGAVSTLLPLAGAAGAGVRRGWEEVSPTARAATKRAGRALERTLGTERLGEITNRVENASPSIIPRTTAATAEDSALGALEAGARRRGTADFASHDREVAKSAWDHLVSNTRSAEEAGTLPKQMGEMMAQGKELFDKLPLSQANRQAVGQELAAIRNSNEVIANPALAKEIESAIQALEHPDATLGLLPQLHWSLGQSAGGSTAIRNARDVIAQVADARSGGQFTNLQQGYAALADQLKTSKASEGIRETFQDMATNTPRTSESFGVTGTPDAGPVVKSGPLRKALANKGTVEGQDVMDPQERNMIGTLADQLRGHEIYTTGLATGTSRLDPGIAEGVGSTALNAGPFWRLRGALGALFNRQGGKEQRIVDEALLNPEKWLALMEKHQAAGRPLSDVEKALVQALRGANLSGAAATTGE